MGGGKVDLRYGGTGELQHLGELRSRDLQTPQMLAPVRMRGEERAMSLFGSMVRILSDNDYFDSSKRGIARPRINVRR
jgi:hypothetical protein